MYTYDNAKNVLWNTLGNMSNQYSSYGTNIAIISVEKIKISIFNLNKCHFNYEHFVIKFTI